MELREVVMLMWYDVYRSATDSEREQLACILADAHRRIEFEVETSADQRQTSRMLTQAIRELRG